MAPYTFFVEYDGGIYLSQIEAANKYSAYLLWCRTAVVRDRIAGKKAEELAAKAELFPAEDLIGIRSLVNAWTFSLLFRGKLVHGSIVSTRAGKSG
ncbi:hypothetical protein [Uliginosibacterium sp. 31-12]|uniref:hypothetical protein n=1 Tax=Uliginosibacterium sp. 31-12 TaxID=3062781 RepID=UPI0026E3C39D|nr:hypothetical protein [Uliginosibacterium sp. 31-12]MDO6387474.1 hypothetical protein [Uliginosibacterium sp. 31-12]